MNNGNSSSLSQPGEPRHVDLTFQSCGPDDRPVSGETSRSVKSKVQGPEPKEKSRLQSAAKKRQASGSNHVKHRRTRNGCYTCRSRRVKCDEQHPVCERCRKGSRDCTYPEHRPTPKQFENAEHGPSAGQANADSSSPEEGNDEDDESPSSGLLQHVATTAATSQSSMPSEGPSLVHPRLCSKGIPDPESGKVGAGGSPSGLPVHLDQSAFSSLGAQSERSQLSKAGSWPMEPETPLSEGLRFYFEYHKTDLSFHHYFFKHDANHFLHEVLIEHAHNYEPLLCAVAGFAAFHQTVRRSRTGHIRHFLEYYNKSVSLLRLSLAKGEPHTDATILTILQLATFEEYLGDWVSLLSHQQAAFRMLSELYTPQSIVTDELHQKILAWYLRFDLTGSLMSGYETVAGRDWFQSLADCYHAQSSADPESTDKKIEAAVADHRLMCTDMAMLFSRYSRHELSSEEFEEQGRAFSTYLDTCYDRLDPVFRDERYQVTSFEGRVKETGDTVDPFRPGGLYRGPLETFNFMMADNVAMQAMFAHKRALALSECPPPNLPEYALELCRIFETIELSPEISPEVILKVHASLGVACLFLPKEDTHILWCRRKLAKIEASGYIYPPTFRRQMATLWNLPEINHWWLPNEEAYPSVVRSVRLLLEDRLGDIDPHQRSKKQRDMRGVFAEMSIQDASDTQAEKSQKEPNVGHAANLDMLKEERRDSITEGWK